MLRRRVGVLVAAVAATWTGCAFAQANAATANIAPAPTAAAAQVHSLAEDAKRSGRGNSSEMPTSARMARKWSFWSLLRERQQPPMLSTSPPVPSPGWPRPAVDRSGSPYASSRAISMWFASMAEWIMSATIFAAFSRMFSIGTDGTKLRQLGQRESDRGEYVMQSDGDVIDWMVGAEGKLLMERTYVPEVGTTGHLISRTKAGLGVDVVDLDTLKETAVERPREQVHELLDRRTRQRARHGIFGEGSTHGRFDRHRDVPIPHFRQQGVGAAW